MNLTFFGNLGVHSENLKLGILKDHQVRINIQNQKQFNI